MPSSPDKYSVAADKTLLDVLRNEALRRQMHNLQSQPHITPATLTGLVEAALQQRKILFDQDPAQLEVPSKVDGEAQKGTVKIDLAIGAGVDAEYQYWRDRGMSVLRRDIVNQALRDFIVLSKISTPGT